VVPRAGKQNRCLLGRIVVLEAVCVCVCVCVCVWNGEIRRLHADVSLSSATLPFLFMSVGCLYVAKSLLLGLNL